MFSKNPPNIFSSVRPLSMVNVYQGGAEMVLELNRFV